MRTTLTDPRLHHTWAFYVAVVLLTVALLVLLHGDVAQGIALVYPGWRSQGPVGCGRRDDRPYARLSPGGMVLL